LPCPKLPEHFGWPLFFKSHTVAFLLQIAGQQFLTECIHGLFSWNPLRNIQNKVFRDFARFGLRTSDVLISASALTKIDPVALV